VRAAPSAATARRSASTAPWKSPGAHHAGVEREVDHAIGRPGRTAQAVGIVKVAAMYPGPGEGSGRGVRATAVRAAGSADLSRMVKAERRVDVDELVALAACSASRRTYC